MHRLSVLTVLLLLSVGYNCYADFLPGTDDIPLMDGITLPETNDFAFDTPAGQILMFEAQTAMKPDQVRSFYNTTLTALGWSKEKTDLYRRDSDTFQLSFPAAGSVRFDVTLSATHN